MGRAKEIIIRSIPSGPANDFMKRHHYSGKIVQNSKLHLGAFISDRLHGVMSFGSPLDKRKVLTLVENTGWNEMLEINRMAFDGLLPRNSESRALSIAFRLLKKNAPHVKWILSFADACECGDGTIYRAAGFMLTGIKKNSDIFISEDGRKIHSMTIKSSKALISKYGNWKTALAGEHGNTKKLIGYQLRYIYLIDKSCRITVPILPFSKIKEMGATMYKGRRPEHENNAPGFQPGEGGAVPTRSLQNSEDEDLEL